MSADIEIIQENDRGVDVTVRANRIELSVHEWNGKYTSFVFDMENEEHRKSLRHLHSVLGHQLWVHRENPNSCTSCGYECCMCDQQ